MKTVLLLAALAAPPLDHSLLESPSSDDIAAYKITTDHSLLPAQPAPTKEVSKPPAETIADVFARYSDAIRHATETGDVIPVVLYRQGNRNDEAIVREHLQLVSAAGVPTQAPFLLHDVTAGDAQSRTLTDFFDEWSESSELPRLSSLWRETENGRTSVTGGGDLSLPATVDQFAGFVARQSRRSRSSSRRRSFTRERVIEPLPVIERSRSSLKRESVTRERVVQPPPVIERSRTRSRTRTRRLQLNRIQAPVIERERLSERQRTDNDLPCSTADCRASSRYTESSGSSYYYTNRRGVLRLFRRR